MADDQDEPRGVTLTNLLMLISVIIAFQSVFLEVRSKHTAWTGIVIGIMFGSIWAIVTGYTEWQLLSKLVKWNENQTLLNICGLGVLVIWPILVGLAGSEMAMLASKFF
jgi:hypothetical protein